MLMHLAVLAMALFADPASSDASTQGTASFRVNGVSFELPIPAGYCLPTGRDIDAVQIMAAADDRNVTHLALFRCDGRGDPALDYIFVKTPVTTLGATVSREGFLSAIGEVFRNASR
jgi:hypothetical protein